MNKVIGDVNSITLSVQHIMCGEAVNVAVELWSSETGTAYDIIAFEQARLVREKTPKSVCIMDNLPCNVIGKLQNSKLMRQIIACRANVTEER
jgi:acyl-CoA synthetase (AMP-forming)/AMP-acid ligase II